MTNLLISHPYIARVATDSNSTVTFDEDRPYANLTCGRRYHLAKEASASTTVKTITYDLGYDGADNIMDSANHLILGRADLLKAASIATVTLKAANAKSGWTLTSPTTVHTASSFSGVTLYGPRTHDYLTTFTASSYFRYWQVSFDSGGASSDAKHSKCYFGTSLDMGCEPSYSFTRPERSDTSLFNTAGTRELSRVDEPGYRFEFTWEKVTDVKLLQWLSYIVEQKEAHTFFLYTTTWHPILDNQRVVHVRLESHSLQKVYKNRNEVTATFQEEVA